MEENNGRINVYDNEFTCLDKRPVENGWLYLYQEGKNENKIRELTFVPDNSIEKVAAEQSKTVEPAEDWIRVMESMKKLDKMSYQLIIDAQGARLLSWYYVSFQTIVVGYQAVVAKLIELGVWDGEYKHPCCEDSYRS